MTKEKLIDKFKKNHTEDSLILDYLEEMYLIGRLDGYNACLEDYWAEITSSAAYTV